jgi:NitT/TauT family transport system substrate-binding protein
MRALSCGLSLAVLSLGCSGQGQKAGSELRKVRVAFSPHLSWGPLMIAQAEGFFRDEGVEVEFVPELRTEESLVALATGDIDVRGGPVLAGFLSAVAQGAKIRITAGQGYLDPKGCTYYGIVLRPGLDTTGTPRIKRMRVSQDGMSRYMASRMLAKHDVSLNAIETNRLPDAMLAMSLQSGAIDAVATSEPTLSRMVKIGKLWLSAQDALPDFQWGVLAFGERLLFRERDTGIRFLRGYNRGVAQFREGKTERNVAIIAEASGESPEIIREACWPAFRADSRINWESIAEFQAWANVEGLMERTVSRDQVWDSTFVTASTNPSYH